MKDRAILVSALALLIAVTLFAWLTWARWGTIGIHPVLGRIVIGAAVFALAVAALFGFSRRRASSPQPRPDPGPQPSPAVSANPLPSNEISPEEPEKSKLTAVE